MSSTTSGSSTSEVGAGAARGGGSRRPRDVVGVALLDDLTAPGRMLAARRTAPPALAGLWEFPGGKVEQGETPREALLREVREELGVAAVLGAEVASPDDDGWPLANGARMRVFLGELAPGGSAPAPLEQHDRLLWCRLDRGELLGLDWIPADVPIVEAVLALTGAEPPAGVRTARAAREQGPAGRSSGSPGERR